MNSKPDFSEVLLNMSIFTHVASTPEKRRDDLIALAATLDTEEKPATPKVRQRIAEALRAAEGKDTKEIYVEAITALGLIRYDQVAAIKAEIARQEKRSKLKHAFTDSAVGRLLSRGSNKDGQSR